MTKPATEARLASAAEGFTEVVARGDSHIITRNPTTGKCCYDGQVGGGRLKPGAQIKFQLPGDQILHQPERGAALGEGVLGAAGH